MAVPTQRITRPIQGIAAVAKPQRLRTFRRGRFAAAGLLATSGTELVAVDLGRGATRTVATGFSQPSSVAVDEASRVVYVLDRVGRRFVVSALSVDRPTRRRTVHKGIGAPGQLAVHGSTLAFVDGRSGTLVAVDVRTRTVRTLASGLGTVGGVAFDDHGTRIHLVEADTGRWLSIAPGEPDVTVEGTVPRGAAHLTPGRRSGDLLLAGADDGPGGAGWVEVLDPSAEPERLVELPAGEDPVAAWQLSISRLVTADRSGIRWWDLRPPVTPVDPVTMSVANDAPFIGSYERVTVDLGGTGYSMEDLDFTFPDGDAAGSVSLSRDDLSGPNEVMLLAGHRPGPHTLVATHRPSGTVAATLDITVTDDWSSPDASPAHWCSGPVGTFRTGYTWGGGPSTPQNVDVLPQSGTRNVAILMVDVSDTRYPTGSAYTTRREDWKNSTVGGTDSARLFFEEVSYGDFSLALAGDDPVLVNLDDDWATTFTTMDPPWPGNSFAPTNAQAFAQACISDAADQTDAAGNRLIDFSEVSSLVLVVRSEGGTTSDDFFWPQAWGGNFTIPGGSVNLAVLGMPDDWQEVRDSRTRTETLAHELGHNIGYPDLYTNVASWNYSSDVQSRDVSNLDLMSTEEQLPAMTIAQRMESGWVRPDWVRTFDFSSSTVPLDETVTLHAIENGAPPSGQLTGVEIRIADGWNYYFEYRRSQAGQIADQQLGSDASTGDGVVVGTDVGSLDFSFPINRPQIIRLRPDAEGELSFFGPGEDYKESDASSMAVADFRLTVLSTSGDTAQVRVEYGTNGRPDLVIRPWPGGNDWQSPDIEVRNARSLADPAQWRNVPWEGNTNTVVATYRNRGPVTCRNVTVDFYVKDFTVSNPPEVWLGRDTRDVPPESVTPTVEFTTEWLPGSQGHRCIVARTPLYLDTSVSPTLVELSDANNRAQSNYSRYISASASPARRVRSTVALHNPFPARALMYLVPQLTGSMAAYYRLYLEHQSLELDPGETRQVEVMVESLLGDPRYAEQLDDVAEKIFRTPANLSLVGYGVPPEAPAHPVVLGGAQIRVDSAIGTQFEEVVVQPLEVVRGRVVTLATGKGVTGHVLVTFRGPRTGIENTVVAPLDQGGAFSLALREHMERFDAKEISLHYPGRSPYGPCDPDEPVYPAT